jgi:hypothetical protein
MEHDWYLIERASEVLMKNGFTYTEIRNLLTRPISTADAIYTIKVIGKRLRQKDAAKKEAPENNEV